MEEVRLQKFLADCGIASRRKCEELILDGKVKVNGNIVKLGTKINPNIDKVEFNGKQIRQEKNDYIYIILNKPIGVVTTVSDQFNRDTIFNYVKVNRRVVPVGRLDMYTSGALILTDDGDFVYKVTHPKHEITKTYTVTIKGIITEDDVQKLREGVIIDNKYLTKSAKVKILKLDQEKNISRIEIIIHEGKNRQVRKMCEAIGKKVIALHRAKIGNIDVKDLKLGKWRYLKPNEVNQILNDKI